MSALYAFCRRVDDIADEADLPISERRGALERWRQDIATIYAGGQPTLPVNSELLPVIRRFNLPQSLFEELLDGVGMDLEYTRYESQIDLEVYCYRVASVVGLLSIEIFGYRDPACRDYAICLGKALQLTNILRDVRIDADRGRIYFPLEELRRWNVVPDEILNHIYTDRFRSMASAMAGRARAFYREAHHCLPTSERPAMIAAELMGAIYWRLLLRLEHAGFNAMGPECPRVSKTEKLRIAVRTWWRLRTRSSAPNYGRS